MSVFHQSALWSLAFRPFFLLASLASVVGLLIWIAFINFGVLLTYQQVLPPLLWHIHEMIFAFTLTIAIGFLLTAVQTWTGLKSLHGYSLIFLSSIWLVIRFLLLLNPIEYSGLVMAIMTLQATWWLIALFTLSRLIIKVRSHRNYIFIPFMITLMIFNLSFIYWGSEGEISLVLHLARSTLLVFSIVVGIIAGRVIPLFTRNAINEPKRIKPTLMLDRWILILSIIGSVNFFLSYFVLWPLNPAWILLMVGLLHLYRLSRWGSFYTFKVPLLWSLHVAYFALGIGLVFVSASFFYEKIRMSDAFHLITVGVFGGMILTMISRVSLGHTGRPLQVKKAMIFAFVLIFIASILRVAVALMGQPIFAWNSSAVFWIIAFSIFLWIYFPILMTTRK